MPIIEIYNTVVTIESTDYSEDKQKLNQLSSSTVSVPKMEKKSCVMDMDAI